MAVVYSKVLLFDPPLIYTAPDICVFGAVNVRMMILAFVLELALKTVSAFLTSMLSIKLSVLSSVVGFNYYC